MHTKNMLLCAFGAMIALSISPMVAFAAEAPDATAVSSTSQTSEVATTVETTAGADIVAVQATDAMAASATAEGATAVENATVTTATAEDAVTIEDATATETETSDEDTYATIEEGIYTISTALDESKSLDMPGASTGNGTAVQIYSDNETIAQRWNITSAGDGYYQIDNVNSGKALDVAGAQEGDGARVQQYDSNGTMAQRWRFIDVGDGTYRIVSALSGNYVLDVAGANTGNGTVVQLYTSNGTAAQRWYLNHITQLVSDGVYTIANAGSGKVLDVVGGSYDNSANVQQYEPNGTWAQNYYVEYDASQGYYTITNLASGKVLDVVAGLDENGANVQQYASNGTAAQKWAIHENADGTFTLRAANGGRVLDVMGGSQDSGANVQIWESNGTGAQKWTFSAVADWLTDGVYTIMSSLDHTRVLDIAGASQATGANVQIYESNDSNAQRFMLRSNGDGFYTIQNPYSGNYLTVSSAESGANARTNNLVQRWRISLGVGGIKFSIAQNDGLVLDVAGASTANLTNVQLWTSNNTLAQRFLIRSTELIANSAYTIASSINQGYVVDMPGASTASGTAIQLYEKNGTAAQTYRIESLDDGTYRLVCEASGKVLEAPSDDSYAVTQEPWTGSNAQRWALSLTDDGMLQFWAQLDGGTFCLDLDGATIANGQPIGIYEPNGTNAQKWRISEVANASTIYQQLSITLAELAAYNGTDTATVNPNNGNRYKLIDLRVKTGVTADQLNAFVQSHESALAVGDGNMCNLGAAFVEASNTYDVNEVYLLAHAILESGWGSVAHYNGVYNYYGIGAFDSDPSYEYVYAGKEGWTTPERGIIGGAQFIAHNYLYASDYAQPTLYAMRWDYLRSDAIHEQGWHQYASSTTWADAIADIMEECYDFVGVHPNFSYVIPKFA